MIKNEELINKVNNIYLNLRSRESSRIAYVEDKLYSYKEYISIVNDIGKTKLSISKAKHLGKTDEVKLNTEKLNILNEKKVKFLENIGINEDILKPRHKCNLCSDTGYINGKRCSCFYKYLQLVTLKALNVENDYINKFKTVPLELTKHYKLANDYVEKFPNNLVNNFIFTGKAGTGKTVLSKKIVDDINAKNYSAIFLTATELNQIFLKMHLDEIDKLLVSDILSNCDLLVIDDLGTEPIYTNVTIEYLLDLISTRLNKSKDFIITTNLTPAEINNRYNERFYSRLSDKTKTNIMPFTFDDLRRKN